MQSLLENQFKLCKSKMNVEHEDNGKEKQEF